MKTTHDAGTGRAGTLKSPKTTALAGRQRRCKRPLAGARPTLDLRQVQPTAERYTECDGLDRWAAADHAQGLQYHRTQQGKVHRPVQHYHDLESFSSLPPIIRTTFSACSNHQRRLTLWRSTATPTATSPAYFLTLQLSVAAGHWADATAHIKPGAAQKLSLSLPESDSGYQISDGYIYAGDDLATANATRMLNTGGA